MNSRSAIADDLRAIPPASGWILRGAAVIAFGLSAYLLAISIRHAGPLGCGPADGCADALSGRWSHWFGLPVALPGAVVYLAIVIASVAVCGVDPLWHRRTSGRALLVVTALAAAAAAWFVGVQLSTPAGMCRYCLAVHACGFTCAGIVWSHAGRRERRMLTPAAALLPILVLGQALPAHHPYAVSAGALARAQGNSAQSDAAARRPAVGGQTPLDRHVRFTAGGRAFDLDPAVLPVLGSPTAGHFIVVMGDYTCEHCRVTHRMLDEAVNAFGTDVGVIVLPVLLDPSSNPYLPGGVTRPPPQDVALARIAMAVFVAKPEAFAAMNRWLFAADGIRGEAEARAYATRLVGTDALAAAERDPRVGEILLAGCELFARTGSGAIPRMLIGTTIISGPVGDAATLGEPLRREWGVFTSFAGETRKPARTAAHPPAGT